MNILVMSTGNSCRSQMAQGILQHLHPDWNVCSAGTSHHYPKSLNQYLNQERDYVTTVRSGGKRNMPKKR